jgi:transcriptional regulator with XRE-family HTH domain
LSLRAAARRSGLSPSGLSQLERGQRTANHASLLAVAKAYNVAICLGPDGGTRIDPADDNPGGT